MISDAGKKNPHQLIVNFREERKQRTLLHVQLLLLLLLLVVHVVPLADQQPRWIVLSSPGPVSSRTASYAAGVPVGQHASHHTRTAEV